MDQASTEDISNDGLTRLASMFNAAIPKLKCQACKNEAFALAAANKPGLISAVHFYNGGDPIPKQFTQTLAVACNNCGHVMHFAMQTIEKLAKQKGWHDG